MNVLVCDPYCSETLHWLSMQDGFSIHHLQKNPLDLSALKSAQALLVRSTTKVDRGFLELTPHLDVVITATAGFDHINLEMCRERGIQVFHTPEAQSQSAAELTLFLMLACLRRAPQSLISQKAEGWRTGVPRGGLISGRTVGVIGLGRIGSRVARITGAMGAKVLAVDPYVSEEAFHQCGAQSVGLSELLRLSDIVTLHVPLTRETRHIMTATTISEMSTQAILINTSRGEVVDEQALERALNEKKLAGAGLDVFANEPLASQSRLRTLSDVVLTPHIGAHTEEAFRHASRQAVEILVDLAHKKNPSGRLV